MNALESFDQLDKSPRVEETLPGQMINENRFEEIVVEALDGVGGTLLFKIMIDGGVESEHVAAGSVGEGSSRHFLILSMPAAGGPLRVEKASDSKYPIAGIAASYAGLADMLAA